MTSIELICDFMPRKHASYMGDQVNEIIKDSGGYFRVPFGYSLRRRSISSG